MKTMGLVLAFGMATLLVGCTTPCGTCGSHPQAVREKLDNCAPVRKTCDIPCVPAPTDIGLDGW